MTDTKNKQGQPLSNSIPQDVIDDAKAAGFLITDNGTIFRSAESSTAKLLVKFAALRDQRQAVPDGFTERQLAVLRFALRIFLNAAEDRATAAAQDLKCLHWKDPAAAVTAFQADAKDAAEILAMLSAAPTPPSSNAEGVWVEAVEIQVAEDDFAVELKAHGKIQAGMKFYTTPPAADAKPDCPLCKGSGEIGGYVPQGNGETYYDSINCPDCGGTGDAKPDGKAVAYRVIDADGSVYSNWINGNPSPERLANVASRNQSIQYAFAGLTHPSNDAMRKALEVLPCDVDLVKANGDRASNAEIFAAKFSKNMDGLTARWRLTFYTDYGMHEDEDDIITAISKWYAERQALANGEGNRG